MISKLSNKGDSLNLYKDKLSKEMFGLLFEEINEEARNIVLHQITWELIEELEATQEAIKLLKYLVDDYVANPYTDSQFISCKTDVKTLNKELWNVWNKALRLVKPQPLKEPTNDPKTV